LGKYEAVLAEHKTRFSERSKRYILVLCGWGFLSCITIEADMQDIAHDSTSVKVHQHAAGAKKGANPQKLAAHAAD